MDATNIQSKCRMLHKSLDGKRCSSTMQIILEFRANYFAYMVYHAITWVVIRWKRFCRHINIIHASVLGFDERLKKCWKSIAFDQLTTKRYWQMFTDWRQKASGNRHSLRFCHRLKSVTQFPKTIWTVWKTAFSSLPSICCGNPNTCVSLRVRCK